ncbi:hypothetical protein [Spiroplasma endosymbiont of Nebria brevicollis]
MLGEILKVNKVIHNALVNYEDKDMIVELERTRKSKEKFKL